MIQGLGRNIVAGARIFLLRDVRRDSFVVDLSQIAALLALSIALVVLKGVLFGLGGGLADPASWYLGAVDAVAFIAAALAVSLLQGEVAKARDVIVVVAATSISINVLMLVAGALYPLLAGTGADAAEASLDALTGMFPVLVLSIIVGAWALMALFRAIACVFEAPQWRSLLLWLVFVVVAAGPRYLIEHLVALT